MSCADCKFCLVPSTEALERYYKYLNDTTADPFNPFIAEMYERETAHKCRRYPKETHVSPGHWCGEFHDRHH